VCACHTRAQAPGASEGMCHDGSMAAAELLPAVRESSAMSYCEMALFSCVLVLYGAAAYSCHHRVIAPEIPVTTHASPDGVASCTYTDLVV
jgi:hypothetical protein